MIEKNNRPVNLVNSQGGSDKHLINKRSNQTHYNKFPTYQPSKFSNAAGSCEICGIPYRKNAWDCRRNENGNVFLCRNVSSIYGKSKDGRRWKHYRNDDNFNYAPITVKKTKTITHSLADSAHLDSVYRAFLSLLTLRPSHSDELLNERQLSDSAIVHNCYASVPTLEQAREVMKELSSEYDLKGVAGFFTDERGDWLMRLSSSGYYVPVFSEENKIVGLQIRLDSPELKETESDTDEPPKYIWFSSRDKLNGTAQTMPLHFSNPHLIKFTNEIILTEGALKAQIIAEKLNFPVVAIAGTGISEERAKGIADLLKSNFPELKTILLTPDSDYKENADVKRAFAYLRIALETVGFAVTHYKWKPELAKGFDDLLNADESLTRRLRNDKY